MDYKGAEVKSGKPFRAVDEVVGASEKVSGRGMAAEVERPGQMCIWRGSPWRAGFHVGQRRREGRISNLS